jgi:microcystin-dependent protein
MTTSKRTRLGEAPEEGIKAPVVTVSTGQETLFGIGQSIASVVIGDMDRIAVAAQTDSNENGIYIARGGKDWERATDFNNTDDVIDGQLVTDSTTLAVYSISISSAPWQPGLNSVAFGLLLSPVGFFWGAITGTLSNQADLQIELDAKALLVHTHVEADITDLQPYLLDAAGSIAQDGEFYARQDEVWVVLDFSVFAPTIHGHVEADISDLGAYLLDAAGSIAGNDELYARANGGWQAFSTSSGTVGEIIAWPDEDPPDNFLSCDGTSQNAVTFADLFAVLGYKYGGSGANFNLPDLRGTFVRGTAAGSGNDPDRLSRTDRGDGTTGDAVGTKQADAVGAHTHGVPLRNVTANSAAGSSSMAGGAPDVTRETNPSTGGGADVRPINIGLNYIIRWTGGGSGITQPPTIEVQDFGVTITTAAQLFNFEGFIITQPVTDEVTIRVGASPQSALFCPGYAYNFLSTTSWKVTGFNVTSLFSVGRRLQFTDGAALYFGTILTSVFFSSDTTMTMAMEDGEVLTDSITEVCLTTSTVDWSPIVEDPFDSTRINGIATGVIGGIEYWVICGLAGRLAYSTNKGLNWTVVVSGTTEDLNDVAYNPTDESFLAVGNAGEYTHSPDGINWTADDTKIAALPEASTGTFNINSVTYDIGGSGWRMMWSQALNNQANAYSTDETATWDSTPNLGGEAFLTAAKIRNRVAASGNQGTVYSNGQDIHTLGPIPDETGGSLVNISGQQNVTAIITFLDGGVARNYGGHLDGKIFNSTIVMDDVTFGSSALREFALSETHQRIIVVADDGKIGFQDEANWTVLDSFALVPNGSNPFSNFTGVAWNDNDGMFVAVNDDGQILRSTTGVAGIIATPRPAEGAGFTLIAADPFSGSQIQHIVAGAIGASNYWIITGGSLSFYSDDAGITWTAMTGGTAESILTIIYDAGNQQFVAGCTNGDFLVSTDGTTWTADTTTIVALGLVGSDDILHMTLENTFYYFLINNGGSDQTLYSDDLITFTPIDVSVPSTSSFIHFQSSSGAGLNNIYLTVGNVLNYWTGHLDTNYQVFWNVSILSSTASALGHREGSASFPVDLVIGYPGGELEIVGNLNTPALVGPRSFDAGAITGQINSITYSTVSSRWCAVGESGEIAVLELDNMQKDSFWQRIVNPFTAGINKVWYDSADNLFIAVGSNGEIGRSTDGIS